MVLFQQNFVLLTCRFILRFLQIQLSLACWRNSFSPYQIYENSITLSINLLRNSRHFPTVPKLICQIVSGLLLQYGSQISPTDEDIEIIAEYSRDFSARIKDSVLDALTYYINILPFDSETKTELLRLSILDIQNGTNMALEYMNKQNALKTRSILYSNEWKTFCAVGNASALFWKSLETRGRIDSRGWFGTFADAAGSLICAGCGVWPGIVVSAIFSLNANYGEPNFDDCMDTNCD